MAEKKIMRLDAETAERQLKLLDDCREMLQTSTESMRAIRDGQTGTVWTTDGKCVDLTDQLREKYLSGVKWLRALHADVDEAYVNLQQAIKETDLIDENQKVMYQNLIYRATSGPNKVMLV